jgi:hypothetical protein
MGWQEDAIAGSKGDPAQRMVRDDVPPQFLSRPVVQSSSRVWGDKEAEAAGLYETPGAAMSFGPEAKPPAAAPTRPARGRWEADAVAEAKQPFGARFAGEAAPGPQRPDELSSALAQRAARADRGPAMSAPVQMSIDMENQPIAAGQRTTPIMSAHAPNLLSAEVHQNDSGEIVFRDPSTGQMVPTDRNKHVVLRDPTDGRLKVFGRTDSTDEGRLSGMGRILSSGALAGAPTARAAAVSAHNLARPTAAPTGLAVAEAAERLSATGAGSQGGSVRQHRHATGRFGCQECPVCWCSPGASGDQRATAARHQSR